MKLFGRKPQRGSQALSSPHGRPSPAGRSPAGVDRDGDARIKAIGVDLLDRAHANKSGLLSARFYQDKLMDWSMKDHGFKVQLFRFVDTFPVLRTPDAVHEHLVDYLTQPGVKAPPGMDLGLKAGGVAKGLFAGTVAKQITGMAENFIAGTDAADALPSLKKLWDSGIAFSVDLLGEACVSHAEADMYRDKYLDLVNNLPGEVSGWPASDRLERDHLGPIARTNVSVKLSSLSPLMDPIDSEGAIEDLSRRLDPILKAAKSKGVLINFDMEQADLKDLTISAFQRACERVGFEAGIAMQAYLRSGVEDARRMVAWARRTGRVVTVRLVKGAYWDYETIHAEEMGWPSKVWGEKWETDRCFEQMVEVFLDACPKGPGEGGIKLALGSHNVRSIAACLEGLERRGLPPEAIELQMLHGMADQLKHAAGAGKDGLGLRVREYVPVGEMIPGMAYLVRRLLENTSNESWLKAGFLDGVSPEVLLAPPGPKVVPTSNGTVPTQQAGRPAVSFSELHTVGPERHGLSPAAEGVGDGRPFFTEPLRDFSDEAAREGFAKAIESARVPDVASDRTPEQADTMLATAHRAFEAWRDFDPIARSRVLIRIADAMRARRDELAAVCLLEAGKPWREADADVCEAIDFCDYYARCAPGLFCRERLGRFIGELDEVWHEPRGVAVVISPWNFPLAIACGMVTAALVTGNTVILKPAEQTPGIAKILYDIASDALRAERAPEGVLHFCPSPGETTGAALVRDPRTAVIAFTGSKAVGLNIIEAAGITHEDAGQHHVKQVICEMGGKNAIIVDASADLDEAVLGVRYSAFGFAGQKCSACSRCIVVDPQGPDGPHARLFLERLVESTRALVVGDPVRRGTDVNPVIDDEAADNIMAIIEQAKAEHASIGGCDPALEMQCRTLDGTRTKPRRAIGPHIFAGVRPEHTLAQREVFGPVLAVMHAPDFESALKLANDHRYKLTGGVFTRKPAHIERAKRAFRVGNLYINRGCTGALVGRQPFGGFGLSGVGSKAGGAEYLYQFVEPRACCENTMRRGFAPEL